jgi:hypothetical protein
MLAFQCLLQTQWKEPLNLCGNGRISTCAAKAPLIASLQDIIVEGSGIFRHYLLILFASLHTRVKHIGISILTWRLGLRNYNCG